jgi:hypothetical protein
MPIKIDRDMLLKSGRLMAIGFELAGTIVGNGAALHHPVHAGGHGRRSARLALGAQRQ